MGKVDDNKKQKKHTLLRAAFQLFTEKGFSKTTVADIVDRAGLAKGTFYLYFKDKFDLRDKLIAYKATQLFNDAHLELDKANVPTFEDEVLFMTDYIIGRTVDPVRCEESILGNFPGRSIERCQRTATGIFRPLLRITGTLSCQLYVTKPYALYDH